MMSLKRSEKAGPEEVGLSSPASQVDAKEQPEACQRGRQPRNADIAPDEPQRVSLVAQSNGTSCTGEARRPSAVQISEKLPRIVPATVRRAAVRNQIPCWMRVRVSTARTLLAKADLSAHCSYLWGSRDGSEVEVKVTLN